MIKIQYLYFCVWLLRIAFRAICCSFNPIFGLQREIHYTRRAMFFLSRITFSISDEILILFNIFRNRLEHPCIFINDVGYQKCKSRTSRMNIIKFLDKYVYEKIYSFLMFMNDQGISVTFSWFDSKLFECFRTTATFKKKDKEKHIPFCSIFLQSNGDDKYLFTLSIVRTSFFTGRNNIYVLFFTNKI